ncbi:hypothetical protein O6H91_13G037100 [Diphasiastrum complanatum]|nr:hypothetical protein O6H91_13G037100 [Diphasiastrum complanatum]
MSVATVADASAAVNFQLWGSECDAFQPGDIVRLTNGIFSFHKTNLVLRAGKKGLIEKVGEFSMVFVEAPNLSLLQWVQDPADPKVWIPLPQAQPSSPGLLPATGGFLGNPRAAH